MATRRKPGIFCLEGDWSPDLKERNTVRPLLQFLEQSNRINFIYRDVGTVEELQFYMNKWRQRAYRSYKIGYFAFHGEPDTILIGRKRLSLDQLGDFLEGACRGKIVYFGSCATLDIGRAKVLEFTRKTKARCVCGYTKDVDWFSSSAFELLLFSTLTRYTRMDAVERHLTSYRSLTRELGFKMYW
ncbi:MAG: hypothetical protein GXO82_05405 [Chlorobi bacterium]|nr:hypothetical protein [Chlorobiota bacterium]